MDRAEFVFLARSFDGCSVTTARERYLDLVGRDETRPMRDYMALPKTSGCALTVRGLWLLAGLKHKRLEPPYKFGMAVADVVAIAKSFGAWVEAFGDRRPGPGDVVLVGDNSGPGAWEHVFVVVECDGDKLRSIDGGQVDAKGNQCILAKERAWSIDTKGFLWDRSFKGSDPGAGRKRVVRGWVDCSKLPFADLDDTDPYALPDTERVPGGCADGP